MIIIGAVFLYMLGFKVLSAFMIFPTAIVSLFIGGGFWAGLIIGVVTGIFMIMHEKRWQP
jgi:multisubunit Na+/H+ antiporter MnhB subunit